jgi:transcription antitermination factor NusA-like protein
LPGARSDKHGAVAWRLARRARSDKHGAVAAHDLGVNYIGICCGAGPHHVRAMAEALGRKVPAARHSPALDLHPMFRDAVAAKDAKFLQAWNS